MLFLCLTLTFRGQQNVLMCTSVNTQATFSNGESQFKLNTQKVSFSYTFSTYFYEHRPLEVHRGTGRELKCQETCIFPSDVKTDI